MMQFVLTRDGQTVMSNASSLRTDVVKRTVLGTYAKLRTGRLFMCTHHVLNSSRSGSLMCFFAWKGLIVKKIGTMVILVIRKSCAGTWMMKDLEHVRMSMSVCFITVIRCKIFEGRRLKVEHRSWSVLH